MSELSGLERVCIETVAQRHWPHLVIDGLQVVGREATGVGLFVSLSDMNGQPLPDGVYEAGGCIIEMDGLPHGLDFAICVSGGYMHHLELVTPGDSWDGVERSWRLVGLDD